MHLTRPLEWTKSFGNMVIGSAMAFYAFNAYFDLWLFFTGFISVAFLWSGLYTLNDFTDFRHDALHPVKKNRPIPSGKVKPNAALIVSLGLIAFSFALGLKINLFFVFCLAAMTFNQLLYTLEPFSLKKRPVLDLISGSLINPFFRFYAGWTLFVPAFNAPLLAIAFILGIQFGGYSLYRLASKSHEEKLGYKSSVVLFGEKNIKLAAYTAILIGILSFIMLTINDIAFPELSFLGVLPFRFILLAFGSLALLPFYLNSLKDPKKADIQKLYRMIYIHYLLFIIGFILLWAFFPIELKV